MTFTGTADTTGASGTGDTGKATPIMTFIGTLGSTAAAGTEATGSTGGGAAHNNMPPYIVKYCWERTA
jgi:microcystin-dependent protein